MVILLLPLPPTQELQCEPQQLLMLGRSVEVTVSLPQGPEAQRMEHFCVLAHFVKSSWQGVYASGLSLPPPAHGCPLLVSSTCEITSVTQILFCCEGKLASRMTLTITLSFAPKMFPNQERFESHCWGMRSRWSWWWLLQGKDTLDW